MLAALRGDEDRTEALAAEAEQAGIAVGARPVMATVQLARGLAALGGGRYGDAYEHLRRMHNPADPAFHLALRCYAVGDLADAAVHSGHGDAVRGVMAEMEGLARGTPSPALHADLRYARALLAADTDAEPFFQAALNADLNRWPFTRARAQLAYGAWLRRQRRAADSRGHLRAARETFDALGTSPWSETARQELRAAGETSRRRTPDARDQLTPQEFQIAQMAGVGLTNREIGQRLYISHRTVSSHLHRIFPKLGVTSRSALSAAVLPAVTSPEAGVENHPVLVPDHRCRPGHPPQAQRFMAQRAHAQAVEVPTSHAAMIVKPDAVTDLIVAAARSTT